MTPGVVRTAGLICVLVLVALSETRVPVQAQEVSERRVRSAIEDAGRIMGQVISGGSPLLGRGGPAGGLGNLSIGAALQFVDVEIEDPDRSTGTLDFLQPAGWISGDVGLFKGLTLAPGFGGFAAVDLFGRLGFVTDREGFESGTLAALGARVGIIEEGIAAPGVGVTIYRSWLDDFRFNQFAGDDVSYVGDLGTWSLRADVSKQIVLVTPFVGVGLDRTSIDSRYRIPAERSTGGVDIIGETDSSSTHGRIYGGIGLAFAPLNGAFEIGAYDGGVFWTLGFRVDI